MTLGLFATVLLSLMPAQRLPPIAMDTGNISGEVVDAASLTPVGGARVMLVKIVEVAGGATLGDGGKRTVTDATGRFAFQQLSSGSYRVDVEKSGFAPSFDPFESKTLELGSGESITAVRVALERGGVIAGGIRDSRGDPLPEMTVSAMRLTRGEPRMGPEMIQGGVGQTNDLGEFRIANLPKGDDLIIATQQGRTPFEVSAPSPATVAAPTYYPGTSERHSAQVITVGAGETAGDVWFSVVSSAAFSVSGVVVDERGTPLAAAMVTLMAGSQPEEPFPFLMGVADRNGAFTVGGVLPGSYFVVANPSFESSSVAGGGGFSIGFGVEVVAGREPVVVFDTPSGRQPTKITVTDADVTGVRVVVTR
jgi:Carboxypeptidase regulatory-like domain